MSSKLEISEGAIAIIDILGIRGLWARDEIKKTIDEWQNIIDDFKDFVKIAEDFDPNVKVNLQVFSDTIILTYESSDVIKALEYISTHLAYPFCHSILRKIFLRGTISVGKFIRSESLIVGPPIDEAVEWYELSDWMGISLSPSADFLMNENFYKTKMQGLYIKYDVPQKDNRTRNCWVLDWPNPMKEVMKHLGDNREPKEALLNAFSSLPVSPSAISKYTNTLKFYETIMKEPDPDKLGFLRPR